MLGTQANRFGWRSESGIRQKSLQTAPKKKREHKTSTLLVILSRIIFFFPHFFFVLRNCVLVESSKLLAENLASHSTHSFEVNFSYPRGYQVSLIRQDKEDHLDIESSDRDDKEIRRGLMLLLLSEVTMNFRLAERKCHWWTDRVAKRDPLHDSLTRETASIPNKLAAVCSLKWHVSDFPKSLESWHYR